MTHPMPPTIEALPSPEFPPEIDDRVIETARAMYIASTPHLTTPEQAIERAEMFERAATRLKLARANAIADLEHGHTAKVAAHRIATLTPYARELRAAGAETAPGHFPRRCAVCFSDAHFRLGPCDAPHLGIALCAEYASIGGDE